MTTIRIDGAAVLLTFTTAEKIAGIVRDQRIPLDAVRAVEVVPDGLWAVHGVRAPGLGLPGVRKIGTARSRRGRELVAVHGHGPAVRLTLGGHHYACALVSTDTADELAAAVAARTR